MDANTYNEFRETFATKASNMSNDELTWALADIRAAMATGSQGYKDPVSGLTEYEQKLFLERDEMLTEMGRRTARQYAYDFGSEY